MDEKLAMIETRNQLIEKQQSLLRRTRQKVAKVDEDVMARQVGPQERNPDVCDS